MSSITIPLCTFYYLLFSGEVWDRARRLKTKMQANLVMAKDRLDVLGIFLSPYFNKHVKYMSVGK